MPVIKVSRSFDVSMAEFDTDDILEELKGRHWSHNELMELKEFVKKELKAKGEEEDKVKGLVRIESLADQLKLEAFAEAINKYSLAEVQKRLL